MIGMKIRSPPLRRRKDQLFSQEISVFHRKCVGFAIVFGKVIELVLDFLTADRHAI
jgi:hypothetical protein